MTEIKNLTVRPPPVFRAKLEQMAKDEGVSIARIVMRLMEEGVEAREKKQQSQVNADLYKILSQIEAELAEIKERLARLEG